jgi:hypothetical protein
MERTIRKRIATGFWVIAVVMAIVGPPLAAFTVWPSAAEEADLAQTKLLADACQYYHLDNGEYPPDLETLAKPRPDGAKAFINAGALKSKTGGAFKYDPAGPKNQGLKPDVWVGTNNSKIGNWMVDRPRPMWSEMVLKVRKAIGW